MRYICPMGSECGEECYASKEHDPVMRDGEPINAAIKCPCDLPDLVKVEAGIIEAAFEIYEKQVIPEDAGSVQRRESRQAFFGGAAIIVAVLVDVVYGLDDNMSDDELDERLGALFQELSDEGGAFADSVVKSRSRESINRIVRSGANDGRDKE